ncbi:MAG: hypothetical protein KDD43_15965 [Bdellovibrionales bacterium]|nr:hypothetical protein [Bdellovibrionales bacterium]
MRASRNVEIGVLVVVVIAIGYLYFPHIQGLYHKTINPASATKGRGPSSTHWLVTTDRKNAYDQMKLEDQVRVRRAVQYFCAIDWDTDSCLHHVITCGRKCLTYLSPHTQEKVKAHYYQRRTELRKGK